MGVLEGKVAVVVGGGTGIGRTTAELFAAEGARVVVFGRRPAPLEAAVEVIVTAGGRQRAGVEVAAALIQDVEGRYLLTQRRPGSHLAGLWEFPGGKREGGETLEACLARELTEELGATFAVGDRVETVWWEYPDKTVVIHFYRCRIEAGKIEPREAQRMRWVAARELATLEFPPADRALIARLAAP